LALGVCECQQEDDVPTYQYACTACGHQLEAVQSFADEPLTECPACEGRLRKLFSSVGVVFKGSGFYRTDSRNSSSKSAETKDSAPAKEAPKKDAPKADKPAAAPAPAAAA
jgi:putative FmdB family regulatory protein